MSPKSKPIKPLDVYVRVSRVGGRDVEADGGTASDQEKRCRAQLQATGFKVGKVFKDLDISGGRESRPEFDKALARIESSESGGLVVVNLSRFGRNRKVPLLIEQVEAWGGTLISVEERLDTSTPMGKFAVDILAAVNTLYLDTLKAQWSRTKHSAWERGQYPADSPAGYDRSPKGALIPNEHADAIRKAFKVKAEGGTWLACAKVLTDAGVATSGGRGKKGTTKWTREGVRSVIQREAYYGLHACTCGCGGSVIREDWNILGETSSAGKRLWGKAQPDKERTVRHRGDGHLLGGGLIRCSTCGLGLIKSSTKGGKYRQMRCPGRGGDHPSISYEAAAEYIVRAAAEHFGVFNYTREEGSNASEVEAAQARLTEAEDALREVEETLGMPAPESSAPRRAVETAEEALAALDHSGSITRTFVASPHKIEEWFEVADAPAQRRMLRELGLSRVVLLPGRKPVAERLQIEFSDGTTWDEAAHEREVEKRARAEWKAFKAENPEAAAKTEAEHKALLAGAA